MRHDESLIELPHRAANDFGCATCKIDIVIRAEEKKPGGK
jgi:hypothetical protein